MTAPPAKPPGDIYEVLPFSEQNLFSSLSSPECTAEEVATQARASYLLVYLRDIEAKTIVVERQYTDGDYLDDFASYYVRCFHSYERRCTRLHFFATAFTKQNLEDLLGRSPVPDFEKELVQSYLGFVVARPLPSAIIGRTLLRTYPSDGARRNYTTLRHYEANLFGITLGITSLPYQEQDTVLAACATVALWSAFHKLADLFGTAAPRPAEITRMANGVVNSSRAIPSHGLLLEQMAFAIRSVGLEPEVISATPQVPLLSLIHAHLRAGLPVILVVSIENIGLHAVTIAGYSIRDMPALKQEVGANEQSIPLVGLRINELYCHDDQVGPFARMHVRPGTTKAPVVFEGAWKDHATGRVLSITPHAVIVPVYNKIRVTFIDMLKPLERLTEWFSVFFFNRDDIEWDLHLTFANAWKNNLRRTLQPGQTSAEQRRLLERPHPRFIWRATLSVKGAMIAEILADATDMERSFPLYEISWFDARFKANLALLLATPALSSVLRDTLTPRLHDLLVAST